MLCNNGHLEFNHNVKSKLFSIKGQVLSYQKKLNNKKSIW